MKQLEKLMAIIIVLFAIHIDCKPQNGDFFNSAIDSLLVSMDQLIRDDLLEDGIYVLERPWRGFGESFILNIEQDIFALENRIANSIKINNPDIANIQGIRQFHIFWLDLNSTDIKKEDYRDYSFLCRLGCTYFNLSPKVGKIKREKKSLPYRATPGLYHNIKSKKWEKYLQTTTLITDSAGNLIATGDARFATPFFYKGPLELPDMKLAKMFFNNEIDFVFWLPSPHIMRYMVGVKDNDLYALERTQEGLRIHTWEEFMEYCFDEWVYTGKKQE